MAINFIYNKVVGKWRNMKDLTNNMIKAITILLWQLTTDNYICTCGFTKLSNLYFPISSETLSIN